MISQSNHPNRLGEQRALVHQMMKEGLKNPVAFFEHYAESELENLQIKAAAALTMADGVDFIPLPTWKIFMIQFLNIAGLGPIFGAIMGAKFGTASYLWIVLGTIFAGAVHDYLSGMLSIRHDGESLPEIIGRYCRNMIVTDDVIESPQSIVIPEAANREISATVVLKRLLEGLK